jgi:hypothetical protein
MFWDLTSFSLPPLPLDTLLRLLPFPTPASVLYRNTGYWFCCMQTAVGRSYAPSSFLFSGRGACLILPSAWRTPGRWCGRGRSGGRPARCNRNPGAIRQSDLVSINYWVFPAWSFVRNLWTTIFVSITVVHQSSTAELGIHQSDIDCFS